jgi:hypothetical protein
MLHPRHLGVIGEASTANVEEAVSHGAPESKCGLYDPGHVHNWEHAFVITRKMVLKITLVLASGRIQARCKDSVKVTVRFIRRGICFQKTESRLSLE